MSGIFDPYGSPEFSLDDTKIAAWESSGSYGTAQDVPSVQVLGGDPNFVEALLEGDDTTTAANSRLKRCQVEVGFGSLSLDVLSVLLGLTVASGGSEPNRYEALKFDAVNAPYIGVCGRALEDGGDGDAHLFFPKAKVTAISGMQMQQDNYVIPRATLQAIDDGDYGILQVLKHETALAVALPPTNVQS